MKAYFSPLFLLLLILASCDSAGTADSSSTENIDEFSAFYERFHRDSAFQMERITFPLQGLPKQADAEIIALGNFRWTKENWTIQKPIELENSDFVREFLPLSDDMVIEKLTHKKWELAITRRFARLENGWHLIYYSALNKVGGMTPEEDQQQYNETEQ